MTGSVSPVRQTLARTVVGELPLTWRRTDNVPATAYVRPVATSEPKAVSVPAAAVRDRLRRTAPPGTMRTFAR